MVQATFPIYFTEEAKKQYDDLCENIESFEDLWESIALWLKKTPYSCNAFRLENGIWLKYMPLLFSLKLEIWIAFTFNSACVRIHGIHVKEL
ncbi:MAG: hypothetical protein LBU13_11785 [Synergistaceae bacterium]|jgi:hypothetical protein|nr:hypothetical protein [Synergistaceae bacterium]